jgi:hypothetical protein
VARKKRTAKSKVRPKSWERRTIDKEFGRCPRNRREDVAIKLTTFAGRVGLDIRTCVRDEDGGPIYTTRGVRVAPKHIVTIIGACRRARKYALKSKLIRKRKRSRRTRHDD